LANCLKCGNPLPAFSLGERSHLCADCNAEFQREQALLQPQPRRDPWDDLPRASTSGPAWLTVTHFLVAVNIAIFVAMVATGAKIQFPDFDDVFRWGGSYGPITLNGQYWRTVSSAFVHIGIYHLAMNMWCLLILTQPLERLMGKFTTFMVYILTAIGASLLSLVWDPSRGGAGASGAVFGIAGVLISFFYFAKLDLPKERVKSILRWVTRFAVINLAFGFSLRLAGIDIIGNAAHLGGLITGLLLGVFFARAYGVPAEERLSRQLRIVAGAAVILVALFPPIIRANAPQQAPKIEPFYGEIALHRRDYASAIAHFKKALPQNSGDAIMHGMFGYALANSHRYDEALREYNQALALQPEFQWVQVNMAAAYLAQGQPEKAVTLFKKNEKAFPWESEDFRYYGDALAQTGDLNGAEAALLQAIKLDPKDGRPHHLLALVYAKMGKTAEAAHEEKFGSADDHNP